jgi:hypothetical protein
VFVTAGPLGLGEQLGVTRVCYCWPPRPGGEVCPDGEVIDFGPCPKCGGRGPTIPIPYCPKQRLLDKIEDIARKGGIEHQIIEHTNDIADAKAVHRLLIEFIHRNDIKRTY